MLARMARIAAALIAAIAWTALIVQFQATRVQGFPVGESLWIMLRYFTILTNGVVAAIFSMKAIGFKVGPSLLAGTTLAIMLVGGIYMLLLRGLLELSSGALLADTLLHKVIPILVPLWWLLFAPKGQLQWKDPLSWLAFPLLYLLYALLRGSAELHYPYPFIDLAELGALQVAINSAMIALVFVLAGYALVALDRRLGSGLR